MKKSLFVASLIFLVAFTSFAQETQIGLKAGVNLNNVSSDSDDFDSKMSIGFHVGPYLNLGISDSYSLQPELLFSMQGSKSEEGDDVLNLSYISIPILGKVYLNENFNIHFGPTIGFLLAAKLEDTDVKDDYKSFDFGVAAGLEYELPASLNFAARYNLGLGNIADTDAVKLSNQVIQVSVGYSF